MELFQELTTLQIVAYSIFLVFALSALVQFYYYWFVYPRFAFWKDTQIRYTAAEPVSIIICARNESQNLQNHLRSVLSLDYPNYEVVVVNDCSYDDSKDVLEAFEKEYSNLKVTTLDEDAVYQHDKKFALTIGIKAAKYENLLLTDADCLPKSVNWVKEMINLMAQGKELVIGYGAYKKEDGFINKLIRFDAFFIALQYFTSTLNGKPYMAVGRNMAYKKSLFFRNKGFAAHAHIKSGDDDLFVNHVATANNTAVCTVKDGHTVSVPKDNFGDWFDQKTRHLTTSPYYKARDKAYIGIQVLSALFFFISFFVLLGLQFQIWVVIAVFLLRIISQIIIFNKAMEKLDEKDLIYTAVILDFFLAFIYPMLTIANTFNHEQRWK